MRLLPAAIVLLAACLLACGPALARPGDLFRCIGANGRSVFADKPCDQLDATVMPDKPKDPGASERPKRVHVHDCARTLGELREGLQAAIESKDVNKVTGFYNWIGTSNEGVDAVLRRFQPLVDRPLVSIELLRPHLAHAGDGAAGESEPLDTAGGVAIVQTRGFDDPTTVRTEFGLTRYMGCWWMRF